MHQYYHTVFGFCLWDLLALIVLAAMVVVLVGHVLRQRRRQKRLEKELAEVRASGREEAPE